MEKNILRCRIICFFTLHIPTTVLLLFFHHLSYRVFSHMLPYIIFYSQFPNTYQAVRVVNGPSDWNNGADLLYVEWCTGEQELYNMTVDPHQTRNLVGPAFLETISASDHDDIFPLLHKLNKVLSKLGDCAGSECYQLEDDHFKQSLIDEHTSITSNSRRTLLSTIEHMKSSIRNRIPCHNPPNMTASNINQRRKFFAYDLPVPYPFQFGFSFSDGDDVDEDLLKIWNDYEHYFH